ncbi:DUF1700 domain-containing protein [Lentibacillus saliphilus]|uniref:DUF1700 domain-containing protein n=1 Tax=Lentibacillus saliphilus TaxID=2737028 RepID=UPI001C307561|nr:DUF1700 domain-containing protein [Lentibacillus saliphilus]
MTKEAFFTQLKASLNGMSEAEKQDILQDFEEHFAIGLAEGKTEHDIAEALGQPEQIAKELHATHHLEKVNDNMSTGNILRAVWAVIGLGFFNLVIVLGPFIGVVGIIFGGWMTGVSFVATPILVITSAVFNPDMFLWFDLFFALLLAGFGILLGIGMYYVTRLLIKGFVKYLHFNVRLVKGGMTNA